MIVHRILTILLILDLGLSAFHLFGGRYRESIGVILFDGTNFGGERMGSRIMLTARMQY